MSEVSSQRSNQIQWRLGIYAGLAMMFLALLPQFHLWAVRGSDWQGTYVSFDFDEVVYSSYLNALLSGRPRRNDPYTGRDDLPERPQPESFVSIQFVPPYALALPARLLGLSAATTFIALRALTAFSATLALFWLLALILGDARTAAAGAIIVLCLGGIAGEPHDAWQILTFRGVGEPLPFLRRYVPALVFPLLFVFIAFIWQALNTETLKTRLLRSAFAGLTLAILIYSYFFLWTTAIAWLFAIALLWLLARRGSVQNALSVVGITAAFAAVALLPYTALLAKRASTVDAAQLLTHSRVPVLSLPVIIGAVVLLALALAALRGWITWRDPAVVFTASLALLPAVTFNQQIVTGLLLQPVHYSRYGPNYAAVLAAVLAAALIRRGQSADRLLPTRAIAVMAILVFSWSVMETAARTHRLADYNSARDEARRVAWRLAARVNLAPSVSADPSVVFCSDLSLADWLPNEAPQPMLWTPHLFVFSGSSATENRERLYRQLYYSGVDEAQFATLAGSLSFLQLAIFGWERMNQKSYAPPISTRDVHEETKLYAAYVSNFGPAQAAPPQLAYVVVPIAGGVSLTNLDRWYVRDKGERVGDYMLYRVELRR